MQIRITETRDLDERTRRSPNLLLGACDSGKTSDAIPGKRCVAFSGASIAVNRLWSTLVAQRRHLDDTGESVPLVSWPDLVSFDGRGASVVDAGHGIVSGTAGILISSLILRSPRVPSFIRTAAAEMISVLVPDWYSRVRERSSAVSGHVALQWLLDDLQVCENLVRSNFYDQRRVNELAEGCVLRVSDMASAANGCDGAQTIACLLSGVIELWLFVGEEPLLGASASRVARFLSIRLEEVLCARIGIDDHCVEGASPYSGLVKFVREMTLGNPGALMSWREGLKRWQFGILKDRLPRQVGWLPRLIESWLIGSHKHDFGLFRDAPPPGWLSAVGLRKSVGSAYAISEGWAGQVLCALVSGLEPSWSGFDYATVEREILSDFGTAALRPGLISGVAGAVLAVASSAGWVAPQRVVDTAGHAVVNVLMTNGHLSA